MTIIDMGASPPGCAKDGESMIMGGSWDEVAALADRKDDGAGAGVGATLRSTMVTFVGGARVGSDARVLPRALVVSKDLRRDGTREFEPRVFLGDR
jgi:hypothetical protein